MMYESFGCRTCSYRRILPSASPITMKYSASEFFMRFMFTPMRRKPLKFSLVTSIFPSE
jgi:hypothetical protein